ncbi:hypothetical protein CO657_30935 (plasmid) [Rhizobium acidisoli]|uniref:Uncharacterized protein n=1 Tax=Rhizobium acidisoli TaxID=1538158 RepID=A0AAE5WTF7_9HYPH|nr:DUF3391 domain-containing protein [Rhizobium acidisoli]QAS82235.1 hypothetical protein CO657_30935 [Rhizobium acidisoli]
MVETLYPFLKFEAAPAMRKRIRLQELRVGMFVDEVESGSQDASVRFSPFLVSSPTDSIAEGAMAAHPEATAIPTAPSTIMPMCVPAVAGRFRQLGRGLVTLI